jgi:hypothetical protein
MLRKASTRPLHAEQPPPYHEEIGQRRGDLQTMQVLCEPPIANLLEAKDPPATRPTDGNPIDHFTWMGRYDGWKPIGRDDLVVWTTPFDAYLIKVARALRGCAVRKPHRPDVHGKVRALALRLREGARLEGDPPDRLSAAPSGPAQRETKEDRGKMPAWNPK